ncbi:MAG: hypothetical protein R6U96_04595 [Promethearchaeia archaeon]
MRNGNSVNSPVLQIGLSKHLFNCIDSLMAIGDKRALNVFGFLLDSCHEDIKKRTEEAFACIDPHWKENLKKLKENEK